MSLFFQGIYESAHIPGMSELLQLVVPIIQGLKTPINQEMLTFLFKGVLPLHTLTSVLPFHLPLCCCCTALVKKESHHVHKVITSIIKWWPQHNTSKEIMLIGEVEELVELAVEEIMNPTKGTKSCLLIVARQMSICLCSYHFQVPTRAPCTVDVVGCV